MSFVPLGGPSMLLEIGRFFSKILASLRESMPVRMMQRRCYKCGAPARTLAWWPDGHAVYGSLCRRCAIERDRKLAKWGEL